jgi:hypothetical protein
MPVETSGATPLPAAPRAKGARVTRLPTWALFLAALASATLAVLLLWPASAKAGVPHSQAIPAYAEEQTVLQLEQGQQEPGLVRSASGIEHLHRHNLASTRPSGRIRRDPAARRQHLAHVAQRSDGSDGGSAAAADRGRQRLLPPRPRTDANAAR